MATKRDKWQEVVLGGVRLKVREPLPETNLTTFPGKVVTGDYTKDNNPLLSSWVISDLSGGHGVEDMNEGVDVNRYRLGTFDVRSPGQIGKGYRLNSVATVPESGGIVSPMYFLADLLIDDAWYGVGVYGTDAYNIAFHDDRGNVTSPPYNTSVVFRGTHTHDLVVIPQSFSGWTTIQGDAWNSWTITHYTSAEPFGMVHAVVWDQKLIAIDYDDNQLWWTIDASSDANWVSYGAPGKLPTGERARKLVSYFDRSGLPTIFVVTETRVWQFDPNGPTLADVDVFFPPHPYHGLAAAKWGGDLYFSVGTGVHRYTGGSLMAMGLDRDHGLPIEYAGYITDLIPAYNALYAFVQAPPDLGDYTWVGTQPEPRASVHEYTGSGWQMIWEGGAGEVLTPHSMGIARYSDTHKLVWGIIDGNDDAWLLAYDLPRSYFNPRQRARTSGTFERTNTRAQWLETGIFDAGLQAYKKTANAIDIIISKIAAGASLAVKYKIDDDCGNADASWTTLGTVTATGTTSLPFGTADADYGTRPGLRFERIQFRFDLTDTSFNAFLMEAAVFSYVKTIPASFSYTLEVDNQAAYEGNSPEVIRDHLYDLLTSGEFVPLKVRGETKRVMLSQVTGAVMTGTDERNTLRVAVVEIPQSLGE